MAVSSSRILIRQVACIAAIALVTIWLTWRTKGLENQWAHSGQNVPLLHKPAPDFRLHSLDGRIISLADYRGRKVILTFWASWCGPCRLELPALREFVEKARKQRDDFEILSINLDDRREDAELAAKQIKLPFPVLLDPGQKIAGAFGVAGIPTLFVIGPTGRVEFGEAGFNGGMDYILAAQLGIDTKQFTPGGANVGARH